MPSKKNRDCGSCTACCTLLRIDSEPGYSTRFDNAQDINKPAGTPCRFLTPQGCGIYAVRPIVCRKFKCDWLRFKKGLTDDDSPEKIKIFFINGSAFFMKN